MSSREQNEANRRNGTLSSVPKTAEGKAASSQNALKHGLLSRQVLLPEELETEFAEFARPLQAELNPQGELEFALSEQIVGLLWRLERAGKLEAGVLFWQRCLLQNPLKGNDYNVRAKDYNYSVYYRERARTIAWQTRENALRHADDRGAYELATLGEAYIRGENSLAKLSRYESAMQRNLMRALHELQRLQAARKGEQLPLPVAIDIHVVHPREPTDIEDDLRREE
jgi:hypothetical protein